jgi:hypothetical protein
MIIASTQENCHTVVVQTGKDGVIISNVEENGQPRVIPLEEFNREQFHTSLGSFSLVPAIPTVTVTPTSNK